MAKNRTRKYTLWLSDYELIELKKRRNLPTLSAWIRAVLFEQKIPPPIKKADPKLVNSLGRIGSNLNQLAKNANTQKALDKQTLNEITAIRKIMQDLVRENKNDC